MFVYVINFSRYLASSGVGCETLVDASQGGVLRHGAYKIIWLFENYLVLTKMIRMLLWAARLQSSLIWFASCCSCALLAGDLAN